MTNCANEHAMNPRCLFAADLPPAQHGPRRDAFHEFHWLPRQGALLKTLPVHDSNDPYDTAVPDGQDTASDRFAVRRALNRIVATPTTSEE